MLSKDTISVLYTLIREPTLNANSIKKSLEENDISLSYYSIQKIHKDLIDQEILFGSHPTSDVVLPGNTRNRSYAVGNYIPEKLGLTRHHVIFRNIKQKANLEIFRKGCDYHPYTHYRTLLLGNGMNTYAQFDIPAGSESTINEFYKQFVDKIGAESFEVISSKKTSDSDLILKKYSAIQDEWDFDPTELNSFWENASVSSEYLKDSHTNHINDLDALDLQLIRELTINAKVKAGEIANYYNKDRTTITKRLHRLEELVMGKPTLNYKRPKFDVSNSQMILGTVEEPEQINKLHEMLELEGENSIFPFTAHLRSNDDRFIMYMMTPPSLSPKFAYFLWDKIPNIEVMTLAVTGNEAISYYFYPINYDVERREWNTSKDYMIGDTIEYLDKIMK